MRFLIFMVLLVISVSSSAQWTIINGKQRFVKGLGLPVSDTMPGIANDSSQIILRPNDSTIWFKYRTNWQQLGKPLDTTSLSNRIDLRVKYTDTANMLLPYLRKADTAVMLSPYLRSNVAAATYIDSVFIQNDSIKYRKNGVSIASTPADTATVVKAYVTNAESVTITKGQVVYIFGAQGDRASVKLAKNTSDTFSSKTLGIVRADIAAGQAGWVTTQGQVSGINLGAYSPGDILWLDSVAGGFTKTKPVSPLHSVFVGVVERANPGNGLIYVKPQNGVELSEVHDVLITSPTNNQVLSYTASTGIWENKSVTTALGYTPLDSVLNIAGSGVALVKGNDQIKRLKAGTGITITDNTDSVTIASTASGGIQWTGVDSSFAISQAENGYHEIYEPMMRGSAASNPGNFWGTKFWGAGNFVSAIDGDINFLTGSTLTSATGAARLSMNDGAGIFQVYSPTSSWCVWSTRVRIPTLNDGTQKFYCHFAMMNGEATTAIDEGVGFLYDLDGSTTGSSASANWQTFSSNNLTRTFNQNHTGVAVAANTWVKLKIIFNSSTAYYYVDNVLIATHTSNMPTGSGLAPCYRINKTAGIVARTFDHDYSTIDIKYSTPR